jgi:hypothetical protein
MKGLGCLDFHAFIGIHSPRRLTSQGEYRLTSIVLSRDVYLYSPRPPVSEIMCTSLRKLSEKV